MVLLWKGERPVARSIESISDLYRKVSTSSSRVNVIDGEWSVIVALMLAKVDDNLLSGIAEYHTGYRPQVGAVGWVVSALSAVSWRVVGCTSFEDAGELGAYA